MKPLGILCVMKGCEKIDTKDYIPIKFNVYKVMI